LFSIFPAGTAGVALLILRGTVAAALLVNGVASWNLMTSRWILIGFALPAAFLCLGFMTPYCALICCVTELATLMTPECGNRFHLCTSILTSAVLAMVGPGAYSIDARIFGRRLVKFSRQEKDKSN
jgi:hypothetical protein